MDRQLLIDAIRGRGPYYSAFDHALVKKAGFSYQDQYARCNWSSLDSLSDTELQQLYEINKTSWTKGTK